MISYETRDGPSAWIIPAIYYVDRPGRINIISPTQVKLSLIFIVKRELTTEKIQEIISFIRN